MNKISFIIPVYPPHYHYLKNLEKLDCSKLDFDIILVLSFKNDFIKLQTYNYKNNFKVIILEDYFNMTFIQNLINKRIIITFKKYFAMNLVRKRYLYCATVDSEIEFVNTTNVFDKFKTFCNNKKIIGSSINTNDYRHKLIKDINLTSSVFFKEKDYNKLINITNNFNIYFWFSDIPIYDMSYIEEFFEFIGFNDYNKFSEKITWSIFDYIPYVYFITLFKNYSLINIKDYGLTREWSLESMPIQTYKKVIEKINYRPLWLIYNVYNENKDIIENDIILTYHLNDGRAVVVNDN